MQFLRGNRGARLRTGWVGTLMSCDSHKNTLGGNPIKSHNSKFARLITAQGPTVLFVPSPSSLHRGEDMVPLPPPAPPPRRRLRAWQPHAPHHRRPAAQHACSPRVLSKQPPSPSVLALTLPLPPPPQGVRTKTVKKASRVIIEKCAAACSASVSGPHAPRSSAAGSCTAPLRERGPLWPEEKT